MAASLIENWKIRRTVLISKTLLLLSLLLVSTIFVVSTITTITPAYSQASSLPSIFVTTPDATTPHLIPLKALKQGSEISQVTTFTIDFTNVIQIPQNGSMIVVPAAQDPSFQIINAKLKNATNVIADLQLTALNTFSLQGIPAGVYTLDVIGQQGTTEGAYETILVIVSPNQPINEHLKRLIQQRIEYEIVNVGSVLIDPGCEPTANITCIPGENMTSGNENNTDPTICTMQISYGQGPCDEFYIPPNKSGECPEGHRFVNDMTGCVPEGLVQPPLTPQPPAEDLPCDEPGHELVDGECLDLRDDQGNPSGDENPPPIDCAIQGGCGGGNNDNEDDDNNGEESEEGDSDDGNSGDNEDNSGGDSEGGGDSLFD